MQTESAGREPPDSPLEQLRYGRQVLAAEGQALAALAERLGGEFCQAVRIIGECQESVIVSGMGKAGLVGQKIAATLASTGTRAHFLHPAEAVHGDLGRIGPRDVALLLSQSGETEEITRLLPALAGMETPLIAITGRKESTLGRASRVVLELGSTPEICSLGLAPSTSTTAMLALGDAVALVASRSRGFTSQDFARFHPGGSLGLKLARVEEVMRPRQQCRIASENQTVREIYVGLRRPGRRTGAVMLVDESDRLTGLFTDSDLARLFETRRDDALDRPVADVMTRNPTAIAAGVLFGEALELLTERKFSELPVVDHRQRPLGMIDITDVVAPASREDGQRSLAS